MGRIAVPACKWCVLRISWVTNEWLLGIYRKQKEERSGFVSSRAGPFLTAHALLQCKDRLGIRGVQLPAHRG